MNTKQIMAIIFDLPIDRQAEIVNQISQTLHRSDPDVEQVLMDEVERRVKQVDSGEVKMIPGDQAMQRPRPFTLV